METNPLVQALKTPIKATGFPSEGYVHSWIVFALKHPPPPTHTHPILIPNFANPPPHTHITICHPRRESPASSFSLPPSPRFAAAKGRRRPFVWLAERRNEFAIPSRSRFIRPPSLRFTARIDSRRGCSPPASIPA